MYKGLNPNNLCLELVMRTTSGVELFHNPTTNVYISEDMDAIMTALKEDMKSNDPVGAQLTSDLFEKLQHSEAYNEC